MSERETRFGHPIGEDPDTGERFVYFWQKHSLFSQWHRLPFGHRGERFVTAEQWMMAGKARVFGDEVTRAKILATEDPAEQKSLGRKVSPFDGAVWEARSFGVVYLGNALKFASGDARARLVETAGFTLVEASPMDTIWGIGLGAENERALRRATWRGQNRLGAVLTALRDDILSGAVDEKVAALFASTGV